METPKSAASLMNQYAAVLFVAVGATAITFAGLFSAATARFASYQSGWLVAYLVLVVGVAQVALGLGQWRLVSRPLKKTTIIAELAFFNLGNAGVIAGTLLSAPYFVAAGGASIIIALGFFGWMALSSPRRGAALWLFWVILGLLLVSVIIGIFFAFTRGGS